MDQRVVISYWRSGARSESSRVPGTTAPCPTGNDARYPSSVLSIDTRPPAGCQPAVPRNHARIGRIAKRSCGTRPAGPCHDAHQRTPPAP